jgi:hypothetical protein
LKDGQPQNVQNFWLDFIQARFRKMSNHPIDSGSPPENTIHQRLEKRPIPFGKLHVLGQGRIESCIQRFKTAPIQGV